MQKTAKDGTELPDTAERVLALMAEIALEKGLDALSMRDVAKRAGISLAALQYHFPSKTALTAAFVDSLLDGYRKEVAALRARCTPDRELAEFITHAVRQTLDDRTGDLFAMLEARSRHDAATERALHRFMQFYLGTVRDILMRRHADMPPSDAHRAATRIVAMIEGLSTVKAAAQSMGLTAADLFDLAQATAEAVEPPPPPAPRPTP
ncbi:TetR/AcrR family transcriptional regulator [Tabrizicola sp. TH137]|uniref:TetR/AcrR family transcriptional regulator n=1 Tax=Tabrizicola sp. TH137 TaxID=2067452 RepID=UPI0013043FAC|nr:TetR/AcrR family transcriptional regulator [Tabrizicola sp. TH137]